MKAFTIQELKDIRDSKYWITKDRYLFYAQEIFNYGKREASDLYEEYCKFPFLHEDSEKPLEIASWITSNVKDSNTIVRGLDSYDNYLRIKVITDNDQYELDLSNAEDAHKYHLLLLHNEKVQICKYVNDHYVTKGDGTSITVRLYEGDVYHNNDSFWSPDRHDAYVMLEGKIRRLLYIKGIGYMSNGKLNLEEGSFSAYAVLGNKYFKYMGNVLVDMSFLKDKEQ